MKKLIKYYRSIWKFEWVIYKYDRQINSIQQEDSLSYITFSIFLLNNYNWICFLYNCKKICIHDLFTSFLLHMEK